MVANNGMAIVGFLGVAGFVAGGLAAPAAAQCFTTTYYTASPVVVSPTPVYVAPAPVVYYPPARYVAARVGYGCSYARWNYYSHGHPRHYRHHGRSWGFGFHYSRH